MMFNTNIHPAVVAVSIALTFTTAAAFIWPSCAQEIAETLPIGDTGMDNGWNTSTSVIPRIDDAQPTKFETATFAVGWFWTPDSRFGSLPGIIRTRVGYSGGLKANPDYYNLGDHTEAFQVDYDPKQISYDQLLELFWASHNPHTRAFSNQYKAAVFTHDAEQLQLAQASKAELAAESGLAVHTEVLPLTKFYFAEDYHQKYYLRHNKPLMAELQRIYPNEREFSESTLAARLNCYVAQHGYSATLNTELDSYGLSDEATELLRALASDLDEGAFGGAACGIAPGS